MSSKRGLNNWHVSEISKRAIWIDDSRGQAIAMVFVLDDEHYQNLKIAQLMASASDLLYAAKVVSQWCKETKKFNKVNVRAMCQLLDEVITRAEGGSQ